MRVAVTGSSGQLGTQVLRRLLDDRRITKVVAIDLRPPRLIGKKLEPVQCDVRDPGLAAHLAGADAVVHLAFIIARQRPRELIDAVNVGGSKSVFAAAAAQGVKSVVYTSSVAAYGVLAGHPDPIVEETPRRLHEEFPYAAAKYRVEEFLDGFEAQHPDIAICRLRPSILIGPGMEHPLGSALKRGIIPDFGAPTLPLVWNEDVADAVLLALHSRARGAFILSAGEQLPAAELARAVGLRRVVVRRPAALALARVSPWLARLGLMQEIDRAWIDANAVQLSFSSEKARRELGWKPRCNTSVEVMRRYVDTVPRRLDRGLARFFRLVDVGARLQSTPADLRGFHSRIHLALTGRGGGDETITIADNAVRLRQGAPDAPTAIVTLPASLLLDLLAGRADLTTAQLTGRLRVEGEGHAVMVLGGMVSQFRALAQAPGVRGRAGRFLQNAVSPASPSAPRSAP